MAIDSWADALRVHKLNHPRCTHLQLTLGQPGDIGPLVRLIQRHIPKGKAWHLHGSPPCQLLSSGNQTSRNGSKGMHLVLWFLQLAKACRPNSWSMEQVPAAYRNVVNLGKFDFCAIVDAANYGLPQNRKRLYVGQGWHLPEITSPKPFVSVGARLPLLQTIDGGTHIRGYQNTQPVRDKSGRHLGNRALHGLEGFRSLSKPSYTLCARQALQLYRYSRGKLMVLRKLTVPETLALQGFPETYRFPPTLPIGTRHKLIGNSLSPLMAHLIIQFRFIPSISSAKTLRRAGATLVNNRSWHSTFNAIQVL